MVSLPITLHETARRSVGVVYLLFGFALYYSLHRISPGHPILVYYAATVGMMAFTQMLEWLLPYEKTWRRPDDQFLNEIASTFISALLGHTTGRFVAFAVFGWLVLHWRGPNGAAFWWPTDWPFAMQVALSFVLWEFGLYWSHRWMHGWAWRFHALHHKLRRLSWLNSGYGHPISFFLTSLCSYGMLALSGAPAEVLIFNSFLSASINFLSHANLDLKFGWLNYVINAPETHRWHHVKDHPAAFNKNFGTQLMLWDLVFGTFYYPKDQLPSRNLGDDAYMPAGFWAQWLEPFVKDKAARWPHAIPAQRTDFTLGRIPAQPRTVDIGTTEGANS
ncbi:sterol desaturase family protein [Paraburkholderia bannensis]|uniref:sterol desaturase family protein n=1 Tax=Paraburkholderia bannensis TaxID=765414 RepID=UPI002AB6CAFC|nr:sterol desaturase family protein [Paraburkholderia bannensis]